MCQDVQQVYLKRHGNNEWSLIFYFEGRSCEVDRFKPTEVPLKLDEHRVHDAPTREELEKMGWCDPDDENVYHIAFDQHLVHLAGIEIADRPLYQVPFLMDHAGGL